MRGTMVLLTTLCMASGCTTLHPIENVPGEFSQHFGDGGVLLPGDRVIIRTLAGATHVLRVRSVHDGVIYGDDDSVPFSDIASIDRRDFSAAKTTALVVVILGVVGGVAAAASSASHPHVGL